MSRGHGAVQRDVLALLARGDRWCWVTDLAYVRRFMDLVDDEELLDEATMAAGPATRSQVESTRRALHRLADEGVVELRLKWMPLERYHQQARLVLAEPDGPPGAGDRCASTVSTGSVGSGQPAS